MKIMVSGSGAVWYLYGSASEIKNGLCLWFISEENVNAMKYQ